MTTIPRLSEIDQVGVNDQIPIWKKDEDNTMRVPAGALATAVAGFVLQEIQAIADDFGDLESARDQWEGAVAASAASATSAAASDASAQANAALAAGALTDLATAGTTVDANFVAEDFTGPSLTGTPRYALDPITGAKVGAYLEKASRNEVIDSDATTAGGPGGLPAYWNPAYTNSGLSWSKVSQDAEGVVLQLTGTSTENGTANLTLTDLAAVVTAAGDRWEMTAEVQELEANNVLQRGFQFVEMAAGGGFIEYYPKFMSFDASAPAPMRAFHVINAGVRVSAGLAVEMNAGVPVMWKIRIRRPQVEKSAYPTSYIPTAPTTGASRTADSLAAPAPSKFWLMAMSFRRSTYNALGTVVRADNGDTSDMVEAMLINSELYVRCVAGGVETGRVRVGRVLPWMNSKLALVLSPLAVYASLNGKPAKALSLPPAMAASTRVVLGQGPHGALGGTVARYSAISAPIAAADVTALAWPAGLFDDFDRDDGPIGKPPTGQTYVQATPWPQGPADPNTKGRIVSGTLRTVDSGASVVASYNGIDLGRAPTTFMAAIAFTSGTAGYGNATLISEQNGLRNVEDITANNGSTHIAFCDNRVEIQMLDSGFFPLKTIFYPQAMARDGVTVYSIGWRFVGDIIYVLLPDGTYRQHESAELASKLGRYCIYETFWQGANPTEAAGLPRSIFHAAACE